MRVVICAESISLAHISRSAQLTKAFNSLGYDCRLAYNYNESVPEGLLEECRTLNFHCISSNVFLKRVWSGQPPYTHEELDAYLSSELALLELINPDIVIGDCRPTLEASCSLMGVPYFPLVNAYWHPLWRDYTRMVPPSSCWNGWQRPRVQAFNRKQIRAASRIAVEPFDAIRTRVGLRPHGCFFKLMSSGAAALFPDVEQFYDRRLNDGHGVFLGPLQWSPKRNVGAAVGESSARDVYLSLGSSGPPEEFSRLLRVIQELGLTAIASAAGHHGDYEEFREYGIDVFDYVNGDQACRDATVVICNGGSPATYQALSAGRPVLGLSSNYDQALNMSVVEDRGFGVQLPLAATNQARLKRALRQLIENARYAQSARVARSMLSDVNLHDRVSSFIDWLEERWLTALHPDAAQL